MTTLPYETHWRDVRIAMQIAVDRHTLEFAHRAIDLKHDPRRYDWRLVIDTDRNGPLLDDGHITVTHPTVVVRTLNIRDQQRVTTLLQHIRNAALANDRHRENQLQRELGRLIPRLR